MRHSAPVNAVAVTPDGTQIISASDDHTVRVWDVATEELVHTLEGHTTRVMALAVTADGTQIVSASVGGTVRIWDRATGSQVGEPLAGLAGGINAVAVTPDGALVAAGYNDGRLILWDKESGQQINEPDAGFTAGIHALVVTPDGTEFISGGVDGTLRIWDRSANVKLPIPAHRRGVRSIALSPDGTTILSAGSDSRIAVWNRETGEPVNHSLTTLNFGVNAVATAGGRVAAGCQNGVVRAWDLVTGEPLGASLTGHTGEVLTVAITPNGDKIVSGGIDGTVRIWTTPTPTRVATLDNSGILAAALTPDGEQVIVGGGDGGVHVLDRTSGVMLASLHATGGGGPVEALAVTPDGTRVVSGTSDGVLRTWDRAGARLLDQWDLPSSVRALVATPDGTQIIIGSGSSIFVLDLKRGLLVGDPMTGHTGPIRAVAVTPDGRAIVSAGDDGAVRRWERATGAGVQVDPYAGHEGPVLAVAVTPDGEQVISGGHGGARIWYRSAARPAGTLSPGHPVEVTAMAVTPDGTRAVTADSDHLVRVWDLRNHRPVGEPFAGHTTTITTVLVTPDSRWIVSADANGAVHVWDLARGYGGSPPPLAEVISDLESETDLLGIGGDVGTIAAVVAAVSTRPPLSVALLGDWGIGKSSFMRQVWDRVEELARGGGRAFAGNVRQVRFNAWHYSDDHLWVGLVEHLFRELAKPEAGAPADAAIAKLEAELSAQQAERDRLDTALRTVSRLDARRRGWLRGLWLPWRTVLVAWAALKGVALGLWGWVWVALVLGAGAAVVVFGSGVVQWVSAVVAVVGAVAGPVLGAWQRLGGTTENMRQTLARQKSELDEKIEKAEVELSQLDPKRRLDALLAEISTAERYESYRGLTGRIHHDLQRLSDDLADARRDWETTGSKGKPPLQRIVLYVDDLDRCTPRRVVDVLQAVNLLLTMELFVVVVAVDPRWLLASLNQHHEGLFSGNTVSYLDKIFHIPVALRPMGARAVDYLRSLLPAADGQDDPAQPERPEPEPIPAQRTGPAEVTPQPVAQRAPGRPTASVSVEPVVAGPNPEGLRLRAVEREFLARLTPILPTPRAIKKLVNLYRLLRLGIPERELDQFIGWNEGGPYQAAALLLAALVGLPGDARALLTDVADLEPGRDVVEALGERPLTELIVRIRKDMPVHGDTATYRRWAVSVARYGFETYALFTADRG